MGVADSIFAACRSFSKKAKNPIQITSPRSILIKIDAGSPGKPYVDILDELNTWKIYNLFRDRPNLTATQHSGWFHDLFPWIDYVRCPAAFGGNFGPSIAKECRERKNTSRHYGDIFWECGTVRGEAGLAERYEIIKTAKNGEICYDFNFFDTCLNRLIDSGVRPHLNISSANERLSNGGAYKYYHWNENPVVHFDRWRDFIEKTFQHLTTGYDTKNWRFSCINEPNCEKREKNGLIYKVGFRGDENDYAMQFAETFMAARKIDPKIRFQMGNYVIRPDFRPPVKSLDLYLCALASEMKRQSLSFDHVSFQSLSMYEVPYQTIYGATHTRFDIFRSCLANAGIPEKPLKIDEFEIHPEIKGKYDARYPDRPLDTTHYAASWIAKAVKAFQSQGVVSAASWFGRLGCWHEGEWKPYPKYYVSAFFPLLSGRIEVVDKKSAGCFRRLPAQERVTWRELSIKGEMSASYLGEKEFYESIEALATKNDLNGVIRILIFRHDTRIKPDAGLWTSMGTVVLRLQITGLDDKFRYKAIGYLVTPDPAIPGAITWDQGNHRTTPFRAVDLETRFIDDSGTLELGIKNEPLSMSRLSVSFFQLTPIKNGV